MEANNPDYANSPEVVGLKQRLQSKKDDETARADLVRLGTERVAEILDNDPDLRSLKDAKARLVAIEKEANSKELVAIHQLDGRLSEQEHELQKIEDDKLIREVRSIKQRIAGEKIETLSRSELDAELARIEDLKSKTNMASSARNFSRLRIWTDRQGHRATESEPARCCRQKAVNRKNPFVRGESRSLCIGAEKLHGFP